MSASFTHPGPVSFYFPPRSSLVNFVPVSGPSPISIQRFSISIAPGAQSTDYTIPTIDLSRTALFFCGCSSHSAYANCDLTNCYFLNPSTIRCLRATVNATFGVECEVFYIEFPPELINSIQACLVSVNPATTTNTVTISEVDLSKSIIIHNGTVITGNATTDKFLTRLSFDNSTTVRVNRGVGDSLIYTRFTVIEFS